MSREATVHTKLELPPGYRFRPTDKELIMFHLTNKVLRKPILDVPITDLDTTQLFQQPPNLVVSYSTKCAKVRRQREWFFYICSEDFPLCHDSNAIQTVPNEQGFWKSVDRYPVYVDVDDDDDDNDNDDDDDSDDDDEDTIGFITEAVYFRGNLQCPKKTHWNMEIYQLRDDFYNNLEEKKQTVLVKIRRGKISSD